MYDSRPAISSASASLKLLTPDDVAALISVERVTVVRLARAGKIPSLKIGKAIRFRPSSIEAWMVEQEGQA
jgi:excisionase family DNA binding protein